jgi:hypothetical protein
VNCLQARARHLAERYTERMIVDGMVFEELELLEGAGI